MKVPGLWDRSPPRWRWVLLSAPLIALCISGIMLLSRDAAKEIQSLATANSDSTQWSLAQVEVEFNGLEMALGVARSALPLEDLRRRFDIFYSRFATVADGAVYAPLAADPRAQLSYAAIRRFLAESVPLMDGLDSGLVAALPELRRKVSALRPEVRQISLTGVRVFSERADAQRHKVMRTLIRVTLLAAALVLALALGVAALLRLMYVARDEARHRQMANHRLAAVVSTSLDGIVVTNGAGRILDFNGAAETLFRLSRARVLGERASQLLFPPDCAESAEAGLAALAGRGRVRGEALRADGTRFPVELSVTLSERHGNVLRVIYLRDIVAQLAAEEELVVARDRAVAGEKAKASFLAVMSHEMRTPLNGMIGALELLATTDLGPDQQEYLSILRRSGDMLLSHVNDVLDLSRLEHGRFSFAQEPYVPGALAAEVVDALRAAAAARGNALALKLTDPALAEESVLGDAQRLRQALVNLVGNAVKFTENGEIRVDVARRGEDLELQVSDTGIGIPPDQLHRIFEDFVTLDSSYMRAAEGTGLGLGIVRRLVEGMGGQVLVDSMPGQGTTFTLRLPAPPAPAAALRPPVPASPPPLRPCRILLVEDNPVNRLVATAMLRKMGHKVTEAEDGASGLHLAEARQHDLILMDISMPGLDGIETTRRIRAGQGPNAATPIIALTAHALPQDMARFQAAGMTHTLTKPITWKALAAILAEVEPLASAVDADQAEDQVIDIAVLQAAQEALGPKAFRDLRSRFLQETEAALADLAEMLSRGLAPDRYAALVHRMSGSAAVFGASALHAALRRQEDLARAGQPPAPDALDRLLPVWQVTRRALQHISHPGIPAHRDSFADNGENLEPEPEAGQLPPFAMVANNEAARGQSLRGLGHPPQPGDPP
ncbi:PAS domain S-box-containing protein [Salipiger marinus]|uniref:histidine kinase n=2 Tax=Salipiger marinus TaxID=555512 RepID=A0A1G8HRY6_9RHOB|nr:PAS domain S-box-containing protein [Salipiger marinus]